MLEMWTLVGFIYVARGRVEKFETQMYDQIACENAMKNLIEQDIAAKDRPLFCIESREGTVLRFVIAD